MDFRFKHVTSLMLGIILICSPCLNVLKAEVLASVPTGWDYYCRDGVDDYFEEIKFALYIMMCDPEGGCGDQVCYTTWNTWLDSTHVDTVLVATSELENYDCLVERLTDGISWGGEYLFVEGLMHNPTGITYGCAPHIPLSFPDSPLNATEFAGATITSIKLIVDELGFKYYDGKDKPAAYYSLRLVFEGSWADTAVESRSWGRIKSIYRE